MTRAYGNAQLLGDQKDYYGDILQKSKGVNKNSLG